jgi:hypothetical protein
MNKTLRFAAMPLALFTGSALAEMSCSALGSQLATQPSVLQVSAAIPLTQVIGTRRTGSRRWSQPSAAAGW